MKNRRASPFLEDVSSVRLVCEKQPGISQWIFLEYFLGSCWFSLSNNRKEIWEEKLQLLPQQRELIKRHYTLLFFHFICLGFVSVFIFARMINYCGKSTGNWNIPLTTGRFPYDHGWCQLFWLVTILSPVAFPFPCYRTQFHAGGTELGFKSFATSACLFPVHAGSSYFHLLCHSAP